jgi:hypothetical protein
MPMKPLAKLLGALTLSAAGSLHAHAIGTCPQGQEPADERSFRRTGASYKAVLCWVATLALPADGGKLLVSVYRGKQVEAQTTVGLDVEGQVRRVRFDNASYVLSSKALTIPVIVEAQLHGATFNQHSTDLLLFTMEGRALKQVFSGNVAWESWGTQCEPDCIDLTRTRTVVVVTDQPKLGFRDLELRTRGTVTPHGKPDSAAQMIFTGSKYESVQ